jgi:hypothetical protein
LNLLDFAALTFGSLIAVLEPFSTTGLKLRQTGTMDDLVARKDNAYLY